MSAAQTAAEQFTAKQPHLSQVDVTFSKFSAHLWYSPPRYVNGQPQFFDDIRGRQSGAMPVQRPVIHLACQWHKLKFPIMQKQRILPFYFQHAQALCCHVTAYGVACYISLNVHWLFASPESSSERFQFCHHVFVSERILANYQWRTMGDMMECHQMKKMQVCMLWYMGQE